MTAANRSPTQYTTRGLRVSICPHLSKRPDMASRPPSWGTTRPVIVDSGQKQATGTWVSGGAFHSCSESSAVEPDEGQMGNVG